MFNYVNDVSNLAHYIIKNFLIEKNVAIDGTLGNGHDTDFLSNHFNKVYAFDIQKEAIETYKNINNNVILINDSHEEFFKYDIKNVDCIMYNLGFLPGKNKHITTMAESSLKSIQNGLEILNEGGLMTIAVYIGHNEGKREKNCILDFVKSLPKNIYGVMHHQYLNRNNNPPELIVIEKKKL